MDRLARSRDRRRRQGSAQCGSGALDEVDMQVSICGLAKENEELFLPGGPSRSCSRATRRRSSWCSGSGTKLTGSRSPSTGPSAVKATFQSSLDSVPGVGPSRKKALIRKFGSVKAIREASISDLAKVEGISTKLAEQIKASL